MVGDAPLFGEPVGVHTGRTLAHPEGRGFHGLWRFGATRISKSAPRESFRHPDAGWPGAVAVLRAWESLDAGDLPEAVFLHKETAALCAALLPLIEREPLFHLHDQPAPAAPLPGGYPVIAVYGEQGPQASGWLRRYHPELMAGLHLLEALARSPYHLAEVGRTAGGGALAHFGRILAERVAQPAEPDGAPAP